MHDFQNTRTVIQVMTTTGFCMTNFKVRREFSQLYCSDANKNYSLIIKDNIGHTYSSSTEQKDFSLLIIKLLLNDTVINVPHKKVFGLLHQIALLYSPFPKASILDITIWGSIGKTFHEAKSQKKKSTLMM